MSVLPFKDDPDFAGHNEQAFADSADELKNFFVRYEALDQEKRDIADDQKDLVTVMKSKGFNVKALKRVLSERKRDSGELSEEKEVAQLYMDLLRNA